MPGRKNYTRQGIERGKAATHDQLAAYKNLAGEIKSGASDTQQSALKDFEGLFFNALTLSLDRYNVHRLRMVTGKDGNPLNEVEMICDSLMNNAGVFQDSSVIKYIPDQAEKKIKTGDRIYLTAQDFERLSTAFFIELERKFLEV